MKTSLAPALPRLIFSLVVGLVAAVLSYYGLVLRGYLASDFEWPLRAAQALMAGQNPYAVIVPSGPYPFHMRFYYPLPAAVAALPFAGLDPYLAGAAFFGVVSAAMAFALADGPRWRLLAFVSPSFLVASEVAQWSPLYVAAALIPSLQVLAVCKPNLGAAAFLYRPTRRGALAAAGFGLVSLVFLPTWPMWWLSTTLGYPSGHVIPVLLPSGFLLVLSLFGWRSGEGRILAVLSFLPQSVFWYDQLPLYLIPRSWRQMVAFSAIAWVGYLGWWWYINYMGAWANMGTVVTTAFPFVMLTVYMPSLSLVLGQASLGWRAKAGKRQAAGQRASGYTAISGASEEEE